MQKKSVGKLFFLAHSMNLNIQHTAACVDFRMLTARSNRKIRGSRLRRMIVNDVN